MKELRKTVKVGEQDSNVFEVDGEAVIPVGDFPKFYIFPNTGEKLYLKNKWRANIPCPKCGVWGNHQIHTFKNQPAGHKEAVMVACDNCKQFIWVEMGG